MKAFFIYERSDKELCNSFLKQTIKRNSQLSMFDKWCKDIISCKINNIYILIPEDLKNLFEDYIVSQEYSKYLSLHTYQKNNSIWDLILEYQYILQNDDFLVANINSLVHCDLKDFVSSYFLREKEINSMMLVHNNNNPDLKNKHLSSTKIFIFNNYIYTILNKLPIPYNQQHIFELLNENTMTFTCEFFKEFHSLDDIKYIEKEFNKIINPNLYSYFNKIFNNQSRLTSFFNKRNEIKLKMKNHLKYNYKKNRVLAIYDTVDLPLSNDILVFIISAEVIRRKYNLDKVDIVFMIDSTDPSPNRHAYVNTENFKQYLYNFAIEHTKVYNFVGSIFVFDNRKHFINFYNKFNKDYYIYPSDYNVNLPIESLYGRKAMHEWCNLVPFLKYDSSLLCLTPPIDQILIVHKWLMKYTYPKIPIAITLREWNSWADERNSQIDEWQKFINDYKKIDANIIFIIIRDYYKLYDKEDPLIGDNVVYCNEASISNSFRAALYQEVTLNMFVSNGSTMSAVCNKNTRYLYFSFCSNGRAATKESLKENLNMYYNDSWAGSSPFQKVIWNKENATILKNNLQEMLFLINKEFGLEPKCYNLTNNLVYKEETKESNYKEYNNIESIIETRKSIRSYTIFYYIFTIINFFTKIIILLTNHKFIKSFLLNYRFIRLFFNSKFPIIHLPKNDYKTLRYEIFNIKKNNKKVIIYGAGTIGEKLYPLLKKNILFYLDNSEKPILGQKSKIKTKILHPDYLYNSSLEFDYIIITPQGREKEIVDLLEIKYQVPRQKMVLFL